MLQITLIIISFLSLTSGASEMRTKKIQALLSRKAFVTQSLKNQSKLSANEMGDLAEEDLLTNELSEKMLSPERCKSLLDQVRFLAHPTSTNDEDLSPVAKKVIQNVTAVCDSR